MEAVAGASPVARPCARLSYPGATAPYLAADEYN